MSNQNNQQNKKIGIIGLSVMGSNLAKNFASRDITTVVYNRSLDKTELLEGQKNIICSYSIEEFCKNLGDSRVILLLVKAGEATDQTLKLLKPYLTDNDILVDLGNADYKESLRRQIEYSNYYVCGISGGEKGARNGASLMLSGSKENSNKVLELLSPVSGKDFNNKPTISYLGSNVEGNIVKTIHNGIEYCLMQVLSEIYNLLRIKNLSNGQISQIFWQWSEQKKDYLCEIMNQALSVEGLVDNTRPELSTKGTGKWSSQIALDNGIYANLINYSYNLRLLEIESNIEYPKQDCKISLEELSNLYDITYRIILDEGLRIIGLTNSNINLEEVKRIWQGGCIIRNKILALDHSLDYSQYSKLIDLTKDIKNLDVPLPLISMLRQESLIRLYGLPAHNLLAVARDVFGGHGFVDLKGKIIYREWN